ncbi:MAG: B12-binding domain-containing radical SAM protein [Candidatus Omnitrophica bacterium]|nr:B12-binding domain-containing radical SAM protein [Candidatus Omnitrophota bacterium]MBU1925980.1 B12-binding domain-containing radical SAM protein [Candidatus Omnitrophota bacterium]
MDKAIALALCPPFWPDLPPLSLISLGSFLIQSGYKNDTDIRDLNNIFFNAAGEDLKKEWRKSSNREFQQNMPEIIQNKFRDILKKQITALAACKAVGFSVFKSNLKVSLWLARELKNRNNNLKVVLGGPEISRIYFKTGSSFSAQIKNISDLTVVGEGELPLIEFLKGDARQKTVCFKERAHIESENFIPAYEKIDPNSYPKKNSVSLLFSRGCPRFCAFCGERLLYRSFRVKRVQSIIDEISYHQGRGVKNFIFHDSMLNADLRALEKLCDEIIANFGKINWEAQMAVRPQMSERLLEKIKQSGCYNLFIGLESGSNNTLRRMRKGFCADEAKVFFKKLNKACLSFGVSLIVGFPKETNADYKESLRFLIENKSLIPKIEQINPFVYYEGTSIDKTADHKYNSKIMEDTADFIAELKRHRFKMTSAFLNNLVEEGSGSQSP